MRLLVLATLAAVTFAEAGVLTGYRYNTPATSYGVPQNSVTENFFNAIPTSPSPGLNLPIIEHQQFNPDVVVSSTPAPIITSGVVSSTPAPSLASSVVSSTPAPSAEVGVNSIGQLPSFGPGFSFTTPAPDISLNSGSIGIQTIGGLPNFGAGVVSSTPAPSVVVTSGSQEILNPSLPNLSFNPGLNIFSTPAPIISSTPAPSINFNSGFNLGTGFNFPQLNTGYNFGLNTFSTPAPIVSGDIATSYQTVNQQPEVSKQVYFYAAPEEPELPRPRINIVPVAPPKKNIRVLFIKAPSPPAPGPIRIAAPPQNEDKTVVYVLVKKPEEQQDIEIQPAPSTEPSKPEVYFIKYRSQQEAEQAISQIQDGQTSSGPQLIADTVNRGDIINSINRETSATALPVINYVQSTTAVPPIINYIQSTTPAPPISFINGPVGGLVGGLVGPGLSFNTDIGSNLIPTGLDTSSVLSTVAPVTVSGGETGFFATSTVAPPVVPHVTYGPPILKK